MTANPSNGLILLHPPATKPSEPPLSLAVLFAHLKKVTQAEATSTDASIANITNTTNTATIAAIDSNLAAFQYLLDDERLKAQAIAVGRENETTIRRAIKHREASLTLLTSGGKNLTFAKYNTAVRYLNTLLSLWEGIDSLERLTLGDYQHHGLSPFSPHDLNQVAEGRAKTIFSDYFISELLPQVAAQSPKYIAISINYIHQALPAFELAGELKRANPEAVLIAGGGLITSWQTSIVENQLRLPVFDHLIFGPGEASLSQILTNKNRPPYLLNDSTEISFIPDFSFATIENYFSPEPILPLTSSRGCYWKQCLFCPEAASPVHPYRGIEEISLSDLLLSLKKGYRVRNFHLTDNAIPVNQLKKLANCGDLQNSGINWFGFVRFEQLLEETAMVDGLVKSGCKMLQLGLESGSQRVLDLLGKGINLATVSNILANLHRAGIATYVYIMLGTPGERREDAQMTLNYLEEHASKIDYLNISIMNLPRESGILADPELYDIDASSPLEGDSPLGLYRKFNSLEEWGRVEARRFLDKELLGSPTIKEIVKRTPPLFTSNHAIFFK